MPSLLHRGGRLPPELMVPPPQQVRDASFLARKPNKRQEKCRNTVRGYLCSSVHLENLQRGWALHPLQQQKPDI